MRLNQSELPYEIGSLTTSVREEIDAFYLSTTTLQRGGRDADDR
jgi:hypothetical protein